MAYKLMSPLVSIVIPSYNVGKYLQEAVESVINQTYTSYELLILDDGSTALEENCALPLKAHKLPYFFDVAPFEEGRTIKNCNAQRALQMKSCYISLHEWELQIKKKITNEGLSEICHYSFVRCLARAVGVQAFDLSSCSESFQLYSFLPLPAEHL